MIGHNVFHSFPERSSSPLYDTVARRRHGVGTPRQGIVLPHWAQTNAGVRFSGLGASNVSSANLARHVLHQNLPCAAPRRSSPTAPRTDCSVVYGIALARALRPVSDRRRATAAPHRRRGHADQPVCREGSAAAPGARRRPEAPGSPPTGPGPDRGPPIPLDSSFPLRHGRPNSPGSFPSQTYREGELTCPSPTQAGPSASE